MNNDLCNLVKRSFEIAQNEIEKILPIYEGTDDIEKIKKQEILFDNFRYELKHINSVKLPTASS